MHGEGADLTQSTAGPLPCIIDGQFVTVYSLRQLETLARIRVIALEMGLTSTSKLDAMLP